jgi:hypothetical protein
LVAEFESPGESRSVGDCETRGVWGDGECSDSRVLVKESVRTEGGALAIERPDGEGPVLLASDKVGLVGMKRHAVDGGGGPILALGTHRARVPNLDRFVLRNGIKPLPEAVEADVGDVGGVAVEGMDGVGGVGVNIKQFDCVVAGSSNEFLVGCNLERIDMGPRKRQRPVADASGGVPELDRMVIAPGSEHHRK